MQEYWLIDPEAQTVEVLFLERGEYHLAGRWHPGQSAASRLLQGFKLEVDGIRKGACQTPPTGQYDSTYAWSAVSEAGSTRREPQRLKKTNRYQLMSKKMFRITPVAAAIGVAHCRWILRCLPTILAGTSLLLSSGCATSPRANLSVAPDEPFLMNDPGALRTAVENQLKHKDGAPQNILVLSGGAAHGAFGAGVLNGWHRTRNVPKWDVVTGISTGALLATCAFLGGAEDYELLHTNYTEVKTSDIIRPKWCGIKPLAAIFASSLSSSAPLKHRISLQITNEKIREVADPKNEHRRLFVGTVDLQSGKFFIWNMTKLAQEAVKTGSPALFDQYRDILLASAAIPGFFPPVKIGANSYAHVDGGTREQLFFRERFLKAMTETKAGYRRAFETRRAAATAPSATTPDAERNLLDFPLEKLGRMAASPTRLYVIVNGPLAVDAAVPGSSALSIGFRSISILTDAALVSDLFATEAMCAKIPNSEFHYLAEGAEAPHLTDGEFDGVEMTKLYNYGCDLGQSGKWNSHVEFDDVNRVKLK